MIIWSNMRAKSVLCTWPLCTSMTVLFLELTLNWTFLMCLLFCHQHSLFGLVNHSGTVAQRLYQLLCSLFALSYHSFTVHIQLSELPKEDCCWSRWSKNDQMGCARLSLSPAGLLPVGRVLLLEALDQPLAVSTWQGTSDQGLPRASPGGLSYICYQPRLFHS